MNAALQMTAHALARTAQRGIAAADLELLRWIGTEVEGGYLVRDKDFRGLERELNSLRERARRLVGKRLVVSGDTVITAYHVDRNKERNLLRHAEGRALVNETRV